MLFKNKKAIKEENERLEKERKAAQLKLEEERRVRKIQDFQNELDSITSFEIVRSASNLKRRTQSEMPSIKYSNIIRSTKIESLFPLVVLDTETTAISTRSGRIVELSAIKYEYCFKPISKFDTLINPQKTIPEEATAINNITYDMVKDSPTFPEVVDSFSRFCTGCNIVGHNLPFDLQHLFCSGFNLPERIKFIDTLDFAKKTLKKYGDQSYNHHSGEYEETEDWDVYDYKLETLCAFYGIERNNAHRSLSDCHATAKVLENLINDKTSQ